MIRYTLGMENLTTVLVIAILAGMAWPNIVRARGAFFCGVGLVLLAMALHILTAFTAQRVWILSALVIFVIAVFDFIAFVLLILGLGGLSLAGLFQEIGAGLRSLSGPGGRGFDVSPPSTPPTTGEAGTGPPPTST